MSFATLPYELQTSIISQLLLPPSSGTDFAFSTASPPPRLNQHRAAILARVSQGCNSLITSVLYRHIWIAKPSALRRLHATFARRPDLATLVRSIHLGPAAELPAKGWPILLGGTPEGRLPELSIKTSVSWGHEEDLWPLWCRPGDASGLKDPSADNCENFAITQALKGAQRDLDVEPWRRGYSRSGRYIGSRRWAQRLYLLQAVLDLYLVEIRRADDERDYDIIEGRPPRRPMGQHKTARACKISLCGHYPRLRVLDGPASSAADLGGGGEVLDVTTAQLWQLLERPGGAGDHFDNILFLAQSTRSALDLGEDEWHKVFSLFGGPHGDRLSDAQWRQTTGNHSAVAADAPDPLHDPDEVGQETGGNDDGDICVARGSSNEDWHSARSDQADAALGGHSFQVEDLINSARSVLLRATKASNVSLTSYLYRALPALPHPHLLRSINIGPFPDWWSYDFLDALAKRMPTLVGMRIVGKLSLRDAAALCLELPALKELRWIWPSDVALPLE